MDNHMMDEHAMNEHHVWSNLSLKIAALVLLGVNFLIYMLGYIS